MNGMVHVGVGRHFIVSALSCWHVHCTHWHVLRLTDQRFGTGVGVFMDWCWCCWCCHWPRHCSSWCCGGVCVCIVLVGSGIGSGSICAGGGVGIGAGGVGVSAVLVGGGAGAGDGLCAGSVRTGAGDVGVGRCWSPAMALVVVFVPVHAGVGIDQFVEDAT